MSKFMSKKVLVAFLVLISIITAGLVIAATSIKAGNTVEVTSAQKLMAGASTKAKAITAIAKGTTATVVTIQKDWANIKLTNSGIKGWVKTSAIKVIVVKPALTVNTISKISTEWLGSGHAKTVEPLAYAGPRDGCVPCHSGNGLERFGTDKPYLPSTAILSNPNDKVTNTFMFDPHKADMPSQIGCATCHTGNGASIAKSGKVPAMLNVYTNNNKPASGGTIELNVGNANALCLTCHNGRRDASAYYKSWTTEGATKTTSYPHHAWGALVSGKGGMEISGVTYAQSTIHQGLGCIGCHMGKNKEGYVSHTFKPDLATCKKCHVNATSIESLLDNSATKKELEEGLKKLGDLILAKVPEASKVGTDNSTVPLVMKATNAKITSAELQKIPTEVLVGCYNYAIVEQELTLGAKGAHNPKYIKALLSESIKALEAAK